MFNSHKHGWRPVRTDYSPYGFTFFSQQPQTQISLICNCGKTKTRVVNGYFRVEDFRRVDNVLHSYADGRTS